jgi:heterodisulfide reductase subunit B
MTSKLLSLALPVRNLALAKDMGLDMLVCCAACYSRFKAANKAMRSNEDSRVKVNEVVGSRYKGEVKVKHLLDVLTKEYGLDSLREKTTKKLTGLRVAAYYGCLLVRPPEVAEFDDPENPTTMDEIIAALGAEAVTWPYKTECYGASLGLTRTDVVLKLSHDILKMASDEGAECIVVACPLCQSNLDLRQAAINERYGARFALPIFYFTQLVGLALGIRAKGVGLGRLMVSPMELLKKKHLI